MWPVFFVAENANQVLNNYVIYILWPRFQVILMIIDCGSRQCTASLVKNGPNYIMALCGVYHDHYISLIVQSMILCRYIHVYHVHVHVPTRVHKKNYSLLQW